MSHAGCIQPKIDPMEAREMWDRGVPIKEIAAKFGARPVTIYRASYRFGWGRHPLSGHRKGPTHVPLAVRFWDKVQTGPSCWEWAAGRDKNGYGKIGRRHGEKPAFAHRVSWELTNGQIPDQLCVLHLCDNPCCVRPDHLMLGTIEENNRQMIARGRAHWQKGIAR